MGRAAVSGPRSVSWRHHRRVIPVISGNRSTAGHVTIIGTLKTERNVSVNIFLTYMLIAIATLSISYRYFSYKTTMRVKQPPKTAYAIKSI